MKSVNDSLEKVRKPRVHIKYEIEENGASVKKEIPFVVGVMGDYSGINKDKLDNFKNRKFVNIDGDNFNKVMESMNPGISIKVDNKLSSDEEKQLAVDLTFRSMDDFNPDRIIEQVEPLKKLIDIRNQLKELQGKADRSDGLEQILETILQNEDSLNTIKEQLSAIAAESEE